MTGGSFVHRDAKQTVFDLRVLTKDSPIRLTERNKKTKPPHLYFIICIVDANKFKILLCEALIFPF